MMYFIVLLSPSAVAMRPPFLAPNSALGRGVRSSLRRPIAFSHRTSDRSSNPEPEQHDRKISKLSRIFPMCGFGPDSLQFTTSTDRPHIAAFILPS